MDWNALTVLFCILLWILNGFNKSKYFYSVQFGCWNHSDFWTINDEIAYWMTIKEECFFSALSTARWLMVKSNKRQSYILHVNSLNQLISVESADNLMCMGWSDSAPMADVRGKMLSSLSWVRWERSGSSFFSLSIENSCKLDWTECACIGESGGIAVRYPNKCLADS